MRPCKAQRAIGVLIAIAGLLVPLPALAQIASKPGDAVGTAGGACNSSIMTYGWPDANGNILKCVSNVWQAQGITASAGGSNTQVQYNSGGLLAGDTGLTYSNPNLTIGYGSIYLGTSAATSGALKIGGTNGISYPANDTNCIGCSIAVGPNALANLPAMPVGTAYYGNIAIGSQVMSSASMLTTAIQNTAVGYQAMTAITNGSQNTALGYQALRAATASNGNTAVGYITLSSITTGSYSNTAVGSMALTSNTTGSYNTAVGTLAKAGTSGNNTTAVGYTAVYTGGTGGNTGIGAYALKSVTSANNTALGAYAGTSITSGAANVAIGSSVASSTLATGSDNILIGVDNTTDTFSSSTSTAIGIGQSVKPGSGDIAIGYQALQTNAGDSLANTAIGYQAMSSASMTTGAVGNTAVGYQALKNNTTGNLNAAFGYLALASNTTGGLNTAIGRYALNANTTGIDNTAVGPALYHNVGGNNNTAVGFQALGANSNSGNTAIGVSALYLNGGNSNVGVGNSAGSGPSGASTAYGTFLGANAGVSIVSGSGEVAVGYSSGSSITTGGYNVTIGYSVASTTLTSGSNNILIGVDSTTDTFSSTTSNAVAMGQSVKPGTGDIAIGYQALKTNAGDNLGNIAIGSQALSSATMTTAAVGNTVVGYQTMQIATSDNADTAFGYQALQHASGGGGNTAIGYKAGQGNAATNGTGNTAVGNQALQSGVGGNNVAIGQQALGSAGGGAFYNNVIGVSSGWSISGRRNEVLGTGAASVLTSGSNNIVIGDTVASTTLTTGSNNILIGADSTVDTPLPGTNNFLNIANLIYGTSIGTAASPGNVGIGTAAPAYPLDIVSNTGSNGLLRLQDTNGGGYTTVDFYDNNGTKSGGFGYGNAGASAPYASAVYFAANGPIPLVFATSNSERMRINSSGNVGIGTTNPMSMLQVNGGEVQIGSSGASCTANNAGAIRYSGGSLSFCNASAWTAPTAAAAGSTGQVQFNNSGALGASSNLFWDNTNFRLGIGTAAPTAALTLAGQQNWAPGLGAITHIMGPTDQTLTIAAAASAVAIGAGNSVSLSGGLGGPSQGNGGVVNITGGESSLGGSYAGGAVNITGGIGYKGTGGAVVISAGQSGVAGGSGAGGAVSLTAGNAVGPANNNGGSITITPGTGTGTGISGSIALMGNVGIGTTSPMRSLDVYGGNGAVIGDGTSGLLIQGDISGVAQITGINALNNANNDIVFNAATANILYLKSSNGNVGIGTTSPSQLLSLQAADARVLLSGTAGLARIEYANNGTAEWYAGLNNDGAANSWSLQNGSGTPLLLVNQSGFVGIGTTNPSQKLEVVGAGIFANASSGANALEIAPSNGGATFWANSNYSDAAPGSNWNSVMTLNSSGNVGIGTTSPGSKLDVNGVVNIVGNYISFRAAGTGANSSNYAIYADTGGNTILNQPDNGTISMRFNNSNTCTLNAGNTSWTCSSDGRLKTSVEDLPQAFGLDGVMKLRPVTYHWRDVQIDAKRGQQLGFVAQQVLQVFPQFVTTGDTTTIVNADGSKTAVPKTLGLNYSGLVVPAIKAIQELKAMLDSDHDMVMKLKADNDNLKAANDTLEVETASLKAANDNEAAEIKELRDRLDALEAARR